MRFATVCVALAACGELDVTTSPYAHESPPGPPSPLGNVSFGQFLGGSGVDIIDDIAQGVTPTDRNIYVVGGTSSADFPTTDGSTLDGATPAGCSLCPFDGFVASFTPSGTLRWARLISSPGYDRMVAVKAVALDRIYIGGASGPRPGLAGWRGGLDPAGERGEQDGLVCALSTSDGRLLFCRYLGGTGAGTITDLDVRSVYDPTIVAVAVTAPGENLHLDPEYSSAFAGSARPTAAGADPAVFHLGPQPRLALATFMGGHGG